jgi:hypothetical protein
MTLGLRRASRPIDPKSFRSDPKHSARPILAVDVPGARPEARENFFDEAELEQALSDVEQQLADIGEPGIIAAPRQPHPLGKCIASIALLATL